ncbi:hypothetical protein SO802_008164, partial [Lithocarpus litseifolius]
MTGCCWAITATTAVEALWTIKHSLKHKIQLSAQELLDCCVEDPKNSGLNTDKEGCYRYSTKSAFKWIAENGICYEEGYPFKGCKGKKEDNPYRSKTIEDGDKDEVVRTLKHHPVAASMDLFKSFMTYKEGIYKTPRDNSDEKSIGGHAILIVGYDMEDGEDYYLIQNSYGKQWGLNGYGKISCSSQVQDKEGKWCPLIRNVCYPNIENP